MSEIDKAAGKYREARNDAALGPEFAPEYVLLKGQHKVWYKTFSHAWVIPAAVGRCSKASLFEKGLLTVYILMQDPETVRNSVMQQLDEGRLLDAAFEFFASKGILPEDIEELPVDKLMQNPYSKN